MKPASENTKTKLRRQKVPSERQLLNGLRKNNNKPLDLKTRYDSIDVVRHEADK